MDRGSITPISDVIFMLNLMPQNVAIFSGYPYRWPKYKEKDFINSYHNTVNSNRMLKSWVLYYKCHFKITEVICVSISVLSCWEQMPICHCTKWHRHVPFSSFCIHASVLSCKGKRQLSAYFTHKQILSALQVE